MSEKINLKYDPIVNITFFPKRNFTNGEQRELPASGLFGRLSRCERTQETEAEYQAGTKEERAICKNTGGISGSTFKGNYRNGQNYIETHVVFLDIEGIEEHTGKKISQNELDEAIKKLGYCMACYSSHSNSESDPRRRVCIPLSRAANKNEAALVTREIARQLNIDWVDPKSFDPVQLMYLPSCSKDAVPVFWYQDGPIADVDQIKNRYTLLYGNDWNNPINWPKSKREKRISENGKKLSDPKDKPGWIGAYNRTYNIYQVLENEIPGVYEPSIDPHRWRFSESSSAPGAMIYDDWGDGTFLYSNHQTDPAVGNHNSFDLVRIHKFGYLDKDISKDTPVNDLPSYRAMIEYARSIPEVIKEWSKVNAVGPDEFSGIDLIKTQLKICGILKELHPENNSLFGWNDVGNGNLYAEICKTTLRYVPERKKWFYFDGVRWKPDTDNNAHAMSLCRNIASALLVYCSGIADKEKSESYTKHAVKWQSLRTRETILKDAATSLSINKSITEFDTDPYLFNCLNGTLNLKNGEFRSHNSDDLITKLANVEYAPGVRCDRWEKFVEEITCGDADLAEYIQKVLGYSLTGDMRHECFFIFYGPRTRNGKSTLCETFRALIGDYGMTANPESLAMVKNKNARCASGDIARLVGARFVCVSEPDKNMTFSTNTLKVLTGGDSITARNLYEKEFTYYAQFKLCVNTNYLPYVTDATLFNSNRARVIPFNRYFSEKERDPLLKRKLITPDALSGVLNWCIEGWRKFLKTDFKEFHDPDAVKEATKEYRDNSDKIANFIEDVLIPDRDKEIHARNLHTVYQDWCYGCGLKPESFGAFKKSLAAANIPVKLVRPLGADRNATKKPMIRGYTFKKDVAFSVK